MDLLQDNVCDRKKGLSILRFRNEDLRHIQVANAWEERDLEETAVCSRIPKNRTEILGRCEDGTNSRLKNRGIGRSSCNWDDFPALTAIDFHGFLSNDLPFGERGLHAIPKPV